MGEMKLPSVHMPAGVLDLLKTPQLKSIKKILTQKCNDKELIDIYTFRDAMSIALNMEISEAEVELIFKKIDAYSTAEVSLVNIMHYLLQICNERQRYEIFANFQPFRKFFDPYSYLEYCDTAIFMQICPNSDGTLDLEDGNYVSVSQNGAIVFWNNELDVMSKHRIDANTKKGVPTLTVTDVACMGDASLIAISTSCWEVRFYTNSVPNFQLQFTIIEFPHCITALDYSEHSKRSDKSLLLCGDNDGNIYLIWIKPIFFLNLSISNVMKEKMKKIQYDHLYRKFIEEIELYCLSKIHSDIIVQIKSIRGKHAFLSCSLCTREAVLFYDLKTKTETYFKSYRGVLSIDYYDKLNWIIAGCIDNTIKIWNIFVLDKTNNILYGHGAPVSFVIVDNKRKLLMSFCRLKQLKIWNLEKGIALQNINCNTVGLGVYKVTCATYNPYYKTLLLHTYRIVGFAAMKDEDQSLYITHQGPVVAALYSDIFDCVITGSRDSVVVVWNLKHGEKLFQFNNLHTINTDEGLKPVEITAMSLDFSQKRLITAGRDNRMKLWNYNAGIRLRTFDLDNEVIYSISYIKQDIYAVGFVVHYLYDDGEEFFQRKWKKEHRNKISSIAIYRNSIIATITYDGELIIWIKEMGVVRCKLTDIGSNFNGYSWWLRKKYEDRKIIEASTANQNSKQLNRDNKRSLDLGENVNKKIADRGNVDKKSDLKKNDDAKENDSNESLYFLETIDEIIDESDILRTANDILFLENRKNECDIATLVSTGNDCKVRMWSVRAGSGILGRFTAVFNESSSINIIVSTTTDSENKYLITGDNEGFLQLWYIENYCHKGRTGISKEEMMDFKKEFPFLRFQDSLVKKGYRKKQYKNSMEKKNPLLIETEQPLLLNKFRAHIDGIVHIEFVNSRNFIITGGFDGLVKLWRLNGTYIGQFGQKAYWDVEVPITTDYVHEIPTDIKRTASPTTFKVLNNGVCPKWKRAFQVIRQYKKCGLDLLWLTKSEADKEMQAGVGDIKDFDPPILGKNFSIPGKPIPKSEIEPLRDVNFKVAAFTEFSIPNFEPMKSAQTTSEVEKSLNRYKLSKLK